jgi:DNA helicase HerA-like ATPase
VRGSPEVYSEWGWKRKSGPLVVAPKGEANPHMLVVGMSGFGKSTLLKSIICGVHSLGISLLVFDEHDEHGSLISALGGKHYDASFSGINIMELDGANVGERIAALTSLLSRIYSLGHIQSTKLGSCLWYTYRRFGAVSKADTALERTPQIRDLVYEVGVFARNAKSAAEKNTLIHLREKLSMLAGGSFSASGLDAKSLMNGINSFSLAGIRNEEARAVYVSELMRRLYSMMHSNAKERGIGLYIVMDEAQRLVVGNGEETVAAKLMEEGRKYGVGVVIATPSATKLPKEVIANSAVFVSFYCREPAEINYVSNILGGSDPMKTIAIKGALSKLQVNQAMMLTSRIRSPVMVKTRAFDFQKYNGGEGAMEHDGSERLRAAARRPVDAEGLERGGFGREEIERALGEGSLERFAEKETGGPKEWYMASGRRPGIEHEVRVRRIHRYLLQADIQNRIIDNSTGPDIEVYLNGRTIPVEYETGSKSFTETSKMFKARIEKYGCVVVATNSRFAEAYERYFGSEKIIVLGEDDLAGLAERIRRL